MLKTIQEKTIFPAYLPRKQQKIVFNPKMRVFMQQNPIVIEVEGIEHRFSPIDRSTDIPNSKKSFNQVMDLMETSDDWANLGTLLAGYKKAGVRLRLQHWGKLIRRAADTGNIYAIIECAKQAERTGLKFQTHEMVVRLLASINDKIIAGDEGATQQAAKWMNVVLDLLHYREQVPRKDIAADTKMHLSRLARGLVLFTRVSAVSTKQSAGEDAAAELTALKDELALLRTLWKDADLKNLDSLPEFAALNPLSTTEFRRLNGAAYVNVIAQNIRAISLSRELATVDANELNAVETALSEHLEQYGKSDERRDARWAEVYEQVLGAKPSWPTLPLKPSKS